MGKEVLIKLANILKDAENQMATLEGGGGSVEQVLAGVRKSLREFHKTAVNLGIKGLIRIVTEMEKFTDKAANSPEDLTTLSYTIGSLRRGLQDGTAESIRSAIMESLELFGVDLYHVMVPKAPSQPSSTKKSPGEWLIERVDAPTKQSPPEVVQPPEQPAAKVESKPRAIEENKDALALERYASHLGGKLVIPEGGEGQSFQLEFPAENLDKIKVLLSPFDPENGFAKELSAEDEHLGKVLGTVKGFMASLAEGNLERAQEVLEELAGVQGEGELYQELGSLARGLHDLLKGLTEAISTELREIVEEKMPDTGNRLEHILHLTEEAATTTLDHAESLQKRLEADGEKLERLERHLAMLKPIGDGAHGRMHESAQIVKELRVSLAVQHRDVETIFTSQGYQDLTGQIIKKVVSFQEELENKLVTLVRSFGMKVSRGSKTKKEELYGPAHEKKEGAAHSQDEVDAILAQFGF